MTGFPSAILLADQDTTVLVPKWAWVIQEPPCPNGRQFFKLMPGRFQAKKRSEILVPPQHVTRLGQPPMDEIEQLAGKAAVRVVRFEVGGCDDPPQIFGTP
jgi:hypothetical protein